jgi:multidrug efflux pump subunit AcrB
VAYRNGAPIRIADVGRVVRGPQNRELAGWANSQRSVILALFKQPGANVISTVEQVKQALPALQASIPPAVHLTTVVDRTQVIRASVYDVEFTLVLAIGLAVMVIFLFLRNFWATVIPSVTVPMALTATLAVMYLLGFSLDNLSLMGLNHSGRLRNRRRHCCTREYLPAALSP